MRTKALILGANPPFEGVWVGIREGREWLPLVECQPAHLDYTRFVTVEVMDSNGDRETLSLALHPVKAIRGIAARAIVKDAPELENISVYLTEA